MKTKKMRAVGALTVAAVLLQGCATVPTPEECSLKGAPESQLTCLDQSLFEKDVGQNAMMGALAGAVLGGAVSFGMSRGRSASIGRIGLAMLEGGMVGGVAGGAIGYLKYLEDTSNNNLTRMQNENLAQIERDNEKFAIYAEASREATEEYRRLSTINQMQLNAMVALASQLRVAQKRMRETVEVHITIAPQIGAQLDQNVTEQSRTTLRLSESVGGNADDLENQIKNQACSSAQEGLKMPQGVTC